MSIQKVKSISQGLPSILLSSAVRNSLRSSMAETLPQPRDALGQNIRRRITLPAVMMRSGTSKGLFLHQRNLPQSKSEWGGILLAAMGSRDADHRQLDGLGGGTSTTSKVAVISKSSRPGIDIDYTFVQIGVGSNKVDFSGNCGNICSGVGPFALDEGLVVAQPGQKEIEVKIFNTNTSRQINQRLQIGPDGRFWEDGDYKIGGVKGTASQIKVKFVKPAGSMTCGLFPTGLRQEDLTITTVKGTHTMKVSLVDAANPFVFVDGATMPTWWHNTDPNESSSLELVEKIRCEAAVKMGLASSQESAHLVRGTPKIAILSAATANRTRCEKSEKAAADIRVNSYSMGKCHPSFQLTGAVCLSAALSIPNTIAYEIARRQSIDTPPRSPSENSSIENLVQENDNKKTQEFVMEHPSGNIDAEVSLLKSLDGNLEIEGVTVSRTARRLFEGNVLVNI